MTPLDDAEREELTELRALFEMQQKRMEEATARWRAEDPQGRELILPDLGTLLKWLMDRAGRTGGAAVRVRIHEGQLQQWDDGPLEEFGQIWIAICAWCHRGPLNDGQTVCGDCAARELEHVLYDGL